MSAIKYDHFKELCQARALKATSQRFVIYKNLVSSYAHPTADQLFESVSSKFPGIGRDTVYRTLNILADCGMVKRLAMPGGATRFDGDNNPHHHFLCEGCGKILDFEWPDFDSLGWPDPLFLMGTPHTASVLVSGQCRNCKS